MLKNLEINLRDDAGICDPSISYFVFALPGNWFFTDIKKETHLDDRGYT